MIALPPSEDGALKVITADVFPPTADGEGRVGAVGIVAGVTAGLEGAEAGPVPAAFVAVMVNVYAVPLVKLVTMIGDVLLALIILPGFEVTV